MLHKVELLCKLLFFCNKELPMRHCVAKLNKVVHFHKHFYWPASHIYTCKRPKENKNKKTLNNFKSTLRKFDVKILFWIYSHYDKIGERSQTLFTHLNLCAPGNMLPNTATFHSARTKQNKPYETWNYTGECSCHQTQAIYKERFSCHVCESADHLMLRCKKRKYPILTLATGG